MSRKPSKPETRIEDYLDVMTGGNAALPQPILRIEFYYAFLAGMTVELPQPILDDEKLLAKICGMEVEAPTYIPGLFPRLYAYMAKKGGQDVQVPDPILRLERYWYDYSAGSPPSVQEYTGAVPVTFVADGTPLLDYIISGNTVQNGTPTPDSPIMPQGTGERTGNLWDRDVPQYAYGKDDKKYNPDNAIALKAGTYTISSDGILPQIQAFHADLSPYADIQDVIQKDANMSVGWGNRALLPTTNTLRLTTIVIAEDCIITLCCNPTYIGTYIMLNTGSEALPYENYGYKIPISSANTTTPVYLGEVETTRKVKKLVLTGEENLNIPNTNKLRVPIGIELSQMAVYGNLMEINTHFIVDNSSEDTVVSKNNYTSRLAASAKMVWFFLPKSFFAGEISVANCKEQFKTWLSAQYAAGTPVTVWYALATEETAVANEPLMRIGDYADTLSMEQAGVSIPTANGSTTLDVETAVKPSEVYIKYRGEAAATLSSLPTEVSSPEANEEENPEETEEEENER